MRIWISLVLILGVILAIRPAATRDQALTVSPRLTIDVRPSMVSISGTVGSLAHQALLAQTATTGFPRKTADLNVLVTDGLPDGWALATDLALRAMVAVRSGVAEVDDDSVTLYGLTDDRAPFDESVVALKAGLDPSMALDISVDEIGPSAPVARQCIELFRTATRGRKIEFATDEATLRTAAYPLLDELASIATDCPGSTIGINGHTDSSGDEAANIRLSQARADAVAHYLSGRGIAITRIESSGHGSSSPLSPAGTRRARKLNRRIEFDLRFPEAETYWLSDSRPSRPASSTTNTSVAPGGMTVPAPRSP
jgi:OOP family OmpA-OmpF porin